LEFGKKRNRLGFRDAQRGKAMIEPKAAAALVQPAAVPPTWSDSFRAAASFS
jgi:hypothetical protein